LLGMAAPAAEIARKIGRSVSAVYSMRHVLKAKRHE
jgi:hypothetical protein